MSNRDNRNGPSHMASSNRGKQNRTGRGNSTPGKKTASGAQRQNRASREPRQSRASREPLNDNYYYEEPPRSRRQGGGATDFEDVSSYSSQRKRKEDQREIERAKKKKKGSAKKKVLAGFLVLLVLVGAGMYYVFGYLLDGLKFGSITTPRDELIHPDAQTDTSIKNIALFGLDAREDEDTGRSDALMVLTVDNKHGKLKLTSILRDSNVEIEGYGEDKITHAYAYGGPDLSIKTLNQNFKLDIDDYVTVNFIQMAKIVDAFGGTKVNISYDEMNEINNNLAMQQAESNDAEIQDSDYMYEDGDVVLNGNQAVAYARIRHLEGGDDMRASRQQNVLKGLIGQLKGKSKLEYPELIHTIMPMCETSLDFSDIMGMLPIMFTDFSMETLSIPGEDENAYGDTNSNGSWVYMYDLDLAAQHINRFIYEESSPYYTGAASGDSGSGGSEEE